MSWAQDVTDPPAVADAAPEETVGVKSETTPPVMAGRNSFWQTERDIWLSPKRLKPKDLRWLVPLAATVAVLVNTDAKVAAALPNTASQIRTGQRLSRIGAPYTLFGVAGSAYLIGRFTKNERMRETGRIGTEALVHSFIVTHAVKKITGRRRPEDGDGQGDFFKGRVSFPSGHAMMSWSLAAVIAHEYHDKKLVVLGAYASALAVNAGRTMAQKHFLSDSLVGSVSGYLLGTYLYHRNHREASSAKWLPEIAPDYQRASNTYGVSLMWGR